MLPLPQYADWFLLTFVAATAIWAWRRARMEAEENESWKKRTEYWQREFSMLKKEKARGGFTLIESLVVAVISIAIAGIGVAALTGCFSRETLDSYVMDKIVTGLLAAGVLFCVAAYGWRNRSAAK